MIAIGQAKYRIGRIGVTVHFAVSHYLTLTLTTNSNPNPNPNPIPDYKPKP